MPNPHCNKSVLQKLLTETLPEREESEIANHLTTCSLCRREFETMAADNEWWVEASTRLYGSAARRAGEFSDSHLSQDEDFAHFSTDFAVDFLEPSDDPHALGRLGEYEIKEVIGRGGMGIVLKGYQKELQRYVAVKVLSPHLATSGAARKRFAREAQATAAVVHPHVMAIHSVNASAKLPYLVMPLVACQSLQERLDQQGPLDLKDVLRIGMQAASGLAAAHAQGLVHRDVKPANILLETNVDRVLLTDFGLARAVDDATLTRTGIIAGTPQYMSPEQANGDAVDRRSDLFSLGGVLYAMCTGRPPFRAETTFGILRRIRETSPRSIREINPDIPDWLERIVMKLLAKEAGDRFGTALDVSLLLEICLAHVQQPMSVKLPLRVGNWPLLSNPVDDSRNRASWTHTGIIWSVALVILVGTGWGVRSWWFPPAPEQSLNRVARTSQPDLDSIPEAVSDSTAAPALASGLFRSPPYWNEATSELDATEDLVQLLEATIDHDVEAISPKNE